MSPEELKLQCYSMAGNMADAIKLYQWLTEDAGLREVQAYVGGRAGGYAQAIAALESAPAEPEAKPLPTMDDIIDPDFTGGLTSEQYLARLHAGTLTAEPVAADVEIPEGFTKWEGGEYPAADSDTIDVLYRNGNHEIFTPGMITDEDTWHHNDDELDIIAYRIISQPAESEEQPEPAEFISDLTGDPAVEGESGLHGEPAPYARKPYRVYVETENTGDGYYFDTLAEAHGFANHKKTQEGVMLVRVQDCSNQKRTVDLYVWDAVTGADEGETHTDDLRTAEGEAVAGDDRIDQQEPVVQLAVEDYLAAPIAAPASTSVLDDPELIEAQKRLTARLEADTLAQVHSYWSDDVRAPPVPLQPEPTGYVGLQDKDLEADYDAMREREKADKPKLHFSIFGERGNRKLEDVE